MPITHRDLVDAIASLEASPKAAAERLLIARAEAVQAGDARRAHALGDLLASVFCRDLHDPSRAKAIAEELVTLDPDKFHLELLADALAAGGAMREAEEALRAAAVAPMHHDETPYRRALAQLKSELRKPS